MYVTVNKILQYKCCKILKRVKPEKKLYITQNKACREVSLNSKLHVTKTN